MEFFCSGAHLFWSTRSRELLAALVLSVDRLVRAFRYGLDERTHVSNRVTHSHDAIVHSASVRRPGRWGPSRCQNNSPCVIGGNKACSASNRLQISASQLRF